MSLFDKGTYKITEIKIAVKNIQKQPNLMYIAHNALRNKPKTGQLQLSTPEMQQRIAAYQAACNKYRQEIAAIQKYLPGWMPAFDAQASR